MLADKQLWLAQVPWDKLVEINQQLCAKGGQPHAPGQGNEAAQKLWQSAMKRSLTLREALDICHQGHALAPFRFFNGNTFAVVVQQLLEEVCRQLSSVEAQILKSTAAHYVAGVVKAAELREVCQHVDGILRKKAASTKQ